MKHNCGTAAGACAVGTAVGKAAGLAPPFNFAAVLPTGDTYRSRRRHSETRETVALGPAFPCGGHRNEEIFQPRRMITPRFPVRIVSIDVRARGFFL